MKKITFGVAIITILLLVTPSLALASGGTSMNGGGTSIGGILNIGNVGQVLGETKYMFQNDIWFGMRNKDVVELQVVLIKEGYLKIPVPTGWFGPLTKGAVRRYQAAHPPLAPDGIVGPLTRAVLNQ